MRSSLKSLFERYKALLTSDPIKTKSISAGLIANLSDTIA